MYLPGFNPKNPKGMKILTWVALWKLHIVFRAVGWEIAASLGNFLGFDKETIQAPEQRFCVALGAGAGWETLVEVKNDVTGEVAFVLIDYDYLLIRWRFCLDFSHHVKDCPLLIVAKRKEANNNGHRNGVQYALGKEPNPRREVTYLVS